MKLPPILNALGYVPANPKGFRDIDREVIKRVAKLPPMLLWHIREADDRFDILEPSDQQCALIARWAPEEWQSPVLCAFGYLPAVGGGRGHAWVKRDGQVLFLPARADAEEEAVCFRWWRLRTCGFDTTTRRQTKVEGGQWR